MSFWKGLAKFAEAMAEKAEKPKRMPKVVAVREVDGVQLLTRNWFDNAITALEGHTANLWRDGGAIIKQHVSNVTNDMILVLKELFEDRMEEQRGVISNDFRLGLEKWFKGFGSDAEVRHQEAMSLMTQQHNQVMEAVKGVALRAAATDHSWGERWLESLEVQRLGRDKTDNQLDLILGTQERLFQNVVAQIQAKHRIIRVYENMPSAKWLMEHANELIDVGDAMKAVRDGETEPHYARNAVIKAFRGLFGPTVSMDLLADHLHEAACRWGLVDLSQQRAA